MTQRTKQFFELSNDEQQRLAGNYVENMKRLNAGRHRFHDKGMRKLYILKDREAVIWPHTGKWIMKFKSGETDSGRDVDSLLRALDR